jgi:hypothetical protein
MATITRQILARVSGLTLPAAKAGGPRYLISLTTVWGDDAEETQTLPATRELAEDVFGWTPEDRAELRCWSVNGRGQVFASTRVF